MVDWSQARPCKLCRAKIVFVKNQNGNSVPVQKVTQLYMESREDDTIVPVTGIVDPEMVMRQKEPMYVSHFQTCPDAGKASKKGKK